MLAILTQTNTGWQAASGTQPDAILTTLATCRHFATIEEIRLAVLEFQRLYNERWLIQRHGYRTPAEVRAALTACLESAA